MLVFDDAPTAQNATKPARLTNLSLHCIGNVARQAVLVHCSKLAGPGVLPATAESRTLAPLPPEGWASRL